jgi:hypothetical protein
MTRLVPDERTSGFGAAGISLPTIGLAIEGRRGSAESRKCFATRAGAALPLEARIVGRSHLCDCFNYGCRAYGPGPNSAKYRGVRRAGPLRLPQLPGQAAGASGLWPPRWSC